jgi:superfamily I DNA/RNA helicase
MPDIRFEASGVDIDKKVVYDAIDTERPMKAYLERLADHWRRRTIDQRGRPPKDLTPQQVIQCVAAIRPDFDLRVSLRAAVGVAKKELLRLTEEQFSVLDGLVDNPRVIVRGGAGTGKTLLAVEEAKRAAAHGSRVIYCCFNKGLAEHVSMVLADGPRVTVETIHGFMGSIVRRAGLEHRVGAAAQGDLYETILPDLATEALLDGDGPPFDVLICDEGQDLLRPAYLDVLDCAVVGGLRSGSWRLFLDPLQDIFEASDQSQVQRLRELGPAQYRLTVNCRNTAPIAVGTGLLAGMAATEVMNVTGPEVEYLWYESDSQLRKSLANSVNRVLSERIDSRDMVILSPRRFDRSAVRDGLQKVGARLVNDSIPRPGELRFMTIHSFKGLESDVVFLIDIDDLEAPASRSAVYVGASRARAILYVLLSSACRPSFLTHAEQYGATVTSHPQPFAEG